MSNVNNTVPGEEQPEQKKKENSIMKEILSWVEVIVIALALAEKEPEDVSTAGEEPVENSVEPAEN